MNPLLFLILSFFQSYPQDTSLGYDVKKVVLNLDIDVLGESLRISSAQIEATSLKDSLDQAILNFVGLTIDSVLAAHLETSYTREDTGINQILIVDLDRTYNYLEDFTIQVYYHGVPQDGLRISPNLTYVMNFVQDAWYPKGARYWYPCFDEPFDKFLLEIYAKVPLDNLLVANGALVSVDTLGDYVTYHWNEDQPISSYLVALETAPNYVLLSDTFSFGGYTVPIMHYVREADSSRALTDFGNVPQMLSLFSQLFGLYPFYLDKFGFVKLGNWYWAIEYQTNVFWALPINGLQTYEYTVAHETAHQWFGDAITPATWKDVWLSEGFATYCEALYADYWEEGMPYATYMRQIMNYYLSHENQPVGHPFPIYDPPDLWNATTYEKGASVLHMLRYLLGDFDFFEMMKSYKEDYIYKNASTEDFKEVAETFYQDDLDWFFEEWVYLPGHPIYQGVWYEVPSGPTPTRIVLHIEQVQSHEYGVPVFKMPLQLGIIRADSETTVVTFWDSLEVQEETLDLQVSPDKIVLDPYNWVLMEKSIQERVEEKEFASRDEISPVGTLFGRRFEFLFDLDAPKRIDLSLYNVAGRKVLGVRKQLRKRKGRFFTGEHLPPGVYFYLIKIDGKESSSGKILKVFR